jgi:hypothetical protein
VDQIPTEKLELDYTCRRLWLIDMDIASNTIDLIRSAPSRGYQEALLRDLVVSICRPFSQSRGGRSLSSKFIPASHRDLFTLVKHLRDKQFAHTDVDLHRPRFMWWNEAQGVLGMSFKSSDQHSLLNRLDELSSMVKDVELKLGADLDALYRKLVEIGAFVSSP